MFFQKIVLFLVIVICTLFACQKEECPLPAPMINPNLAGDFYVERIRRGSFRDPYGVTSRDWFDTADVALVCTLDEDTLKVLGFSLAIDSVNQTVFSYADSMGSLGVTSIRVQYTNNYDSMYIEYKTPCSINYNCSTINYKGSRGGTVTLPNSGSLYVLQVNHKKTRLIIPGPIVTLVDTQYTKDIIIQHSTGYTPPLAPDLATVQFDLENTIFNFEGFESYYRHTTEGMPERLYQKVYWKNDSFYLEQKLLEYTNGWGVPADTTYYLYQGRVK
ncbi:MAG: hypothetical protein AB8E82_01995 [Aureispira sp.]